MHHVHYFGTNMACFDTEARNLLAQHEARELVVAIPVPCPDPYCNGSHMLLAVAATEDVAMAMQPLEEGHSARVRFVSQLMEALPHLLVAQFGADVVDQAMRSLELQQVLRQVLLAVEDPDSSHPRNN